MVYADIIALYENGEHYDSLYGGASPGNDDVQKIGEGPQDPSSDPLPMIKPQVLKSGDPEDLNEDPILSTHAPTPQSRDPTNEPDKQVLLKPVDVDYLEDWRVLYDNVDDQLSLYEDEEWWRNFDEALKDEDPVPVNFPELTEEELNKYVIEPENLQDVLEKYKTICNPEDGRGNFKQTNKGDILKSAKNLYEYFNCRVYFLRLLPRILKANKTLTQIFDTVTVKSITNLVDNLTEDKLKSHSKSELYLFKDILTNLSTHLETIIPDESFIEQFISKKGETSKLKTLTEKLNQVLKPSNEPSNMKGIKYFFGYMSRDAVSEPKPQEIIDKTNRVIDSYFYKDLLDLTYEIRDLLLDYYLQQEKEKGAAESIQAKWRAFKERQLDTEKGKRLEKYIGKYYEKKQEGQADPQVQPSAEQPSAEQPSAEQPVAQSEPGQAPAQAAEGDDIPEGKLPDRTALNNEVVLTVEAKSEAKSELQKKLAEIEEKNSPKLDKLKLDEEKAREKEEQLIQKILEDEKKLYLSFFGPSTDDGSVRSPDIPTIYDQIEEVNEFKPDGYSERELDSEILDQLNKFLKKIYINIDIPLIKEISLKINDTKGKMDEMIAKYTETKLKINDLENTLNQEIKRYMNPKEDGEGVEGEVIRVSPQQFYSGRNIISSLKMCWENIDGKKEIILSIFKNQNYLEFKKEMLKINTLIEVIKKYNVYIDSYLSIAKYIALEKICNYLITLYYNSGDTQDGKIIDRTEKLFKNLITENIIKDYHLNDKIDYSLLFFEVIEKTLEELKEEIKYARIAPITEKFKLTDEGEPAPAYNRTEPVEGVLVSRDVAEIRADVKGKVLGVRDGGGKRRRLTNKKRNRRERTNKKRRSIRKTNKRNTKKERTPKKSILKTERTPKKNTLKKRRV